MRIQHCISIIVLLLMGLPDQTCAQDFEWGFLIGGTTSGSQANGVATDNENNVYVTGCFQGTVDFDPLPSSEFNLTSNGLTDIYLAKYNSTGALVWAIAIGSELTHNTHGDIGEDIALDGGGNIFITGYFRGNVDFDPSDNEAILTAPDDDFFIAKYDNDGNYLWADHGGSYTYEPSFSNSIVVDNDDNAVITGSFNRRITIGSFSLDVGSGNTGAFLAKYNPTGTVLFAAELGGTDHTIGHGVVCGPTGALYVMGDFNGSDQFGAFQLSGGPSLSVFVCKLNDTGEVEWAKEIVSQSSVNGKSLTIDQYENLHLTGDYYQIVDADPSSTDYILSSNGSSDIFLLSLNLYGEFRWGQSIGNTEVDYVYGMGISEHQEISITGRFNGELDVDPSGNIQSLISGGEEDAFISAYSFAGEFRWAVSFEDQGSDTDQGSTVTYDNSNNVICTGRLSGTVDFDPETGQNILSTNGREGSYVVKLTGIETFPHSSMVLHVPLLYPTIQSGINTADSSDIVLLQPGTYYENLIWPQRSGINLLSTGDRTNTIIDGNGLTSVILMNPQVVSIDSTTSIQGITVRNGGNAYYGGGISLIGASPTLSDLNIQDNSGSRAGGIYLTNSTPILSRLSITNNFSEDDGGGIAAISSNLLVEYSHIQNNVSTDDGGGIYAYHSSLTLSNVILLGNEGNEGGGICFGSDATAEFENVSVISNSAFRGGGLSVIPFADISILDMNVIGNSAVGKGGGIYVEHEGDIAFQNINLISNTAQEEGAGIYWNDHNGVHTLSYSNIMENGNGMFGTGTIGALNNFWGHSSGPTHTAQNPIGQGDTVNVNVSVTPWLTLPHPDSPPLPPQNVTVSSIGNDFLLLDWEFSLIPDFDRFRLYYDEDQRGYPYANYLELGTEPSFTLSGLNLGSEYYIAVTAFDSDGNESWYSKEVTGVTRIMEVQNLDIGGDENLDHITSHAPHVTFDYFDSMVETQTNYCIQLSDDSTFQNYLWNPGEVEGNETTISVPEGLLVNGETYFLRMKVSSGDFWSDWSSLSFRMNSEPEAPTQISLINNAISVGSVNLVVGNSLDGEGDDLTYCFRLYTDESLNTPIDSSLAVLPGIDETSWCVAATLDDNSQFWWTIQSYDGFEFSRLVGPESFLVNNENDIPSEFAILYPTTGGNANSLTPFLSWQSSYDPDPLDTLSYTIYLDTPAPGVEVFSVGLDTFFQVVEPLADNTPYHWKVVAEDLHGGSRENIEGYQSFTVNTENDLPVAFNLLSPIANMMVTTLTPEFLWESSSDPDDETIVMRSTGKDRKTDQLSGVDNSVMVITGYDFYLGTDAALTDVVPVEVIGTSYTPDTDLTENQVYYWVVSAIDDSGGVTFSDTASFWSNSENSAPEPLTLLTPVMASETDLTPTFSWTLTTDADLNDTLNYTLMFGTDPFSLMSVNMGAESQYVPEEPLMDNTEYIWQVIATDIQGATYTTEFFSFFVNSENDVPVEFTLVGPDSGSYLANADVMLVWTPSTDLEGDAIAYRVLFGETIETLEAIDTVGVNYYELNDLADGYYVWQVEAMDEMDGTLASPIWGFLINVNNDPPEPFSLIYPTAEMLLTDQQPMFTWEASSSGDAGDHTSYRLELGTNAEDMAVVYEGDSTHFTPELALEDNAIYYWQVTAIDMAYATTINEGGYQNFILNTVNDGPSMAELISPDSVIVLSDTPVFNWTASTDIDPNDSLTYEVHWWTDLTEMDSIITTETQASPATPLADDNLEYTWNVITMDAHGGIAHSEEKTFWVDFMPEVPASFALLGPDSASAGNGTRPELTWAEAIDPDPFDAVHYSIAIATDSLMENVVFEEVAHIETWMPETDLDNDTRYYWQVTAIDEDSLTTESSIWTFDVGYVATDEFAQLPDEFTLKQNYPNPFNPSTTIRYGLPEDTNVSLVIYDVRGQIVQTIASKHQSAGWYDIVWNGQTMDGKTISTGIYFARLVAGEYSQVIKMLYLK